MEKNHFSKPKLNNNEFLKRIFKLKYSLFIFAAQKPQYQQKRYTEKLSQTNIYTNS